MKISRVGWFLAVIEILMSLLLGTLVVLHMYNPRIGFLTRPMSVSFLFLFAIVTLVWAVSLLISGMEKNKSWKEQKNR